jgi:hypothetical protein
MGRQYRSSVCRLHKHKNDTRSDFFQKNDLSDILLDFSNSQEFWVLLTTLSEKLLTNLCNSLYIQQETAKFIIASLKRYIGKINANRILH